MPSFAYLKEADLAPLATAADSWKALPAKYQSLHDEFTRRVITHLEGHWEGDASEAAFSVMKKARRQYEDAATEAGRIAKLLSDAHGEFAKFQKQLHSLIDNARADHFRISEKGVIEDVHPTHQDVGARHDPDYEDVFVPERNKKLDSLEARINQVLELATAADQAASYALERDANGDNSKSFNTKVHTTLDAAEAQQAYALAKKGDKLTNVELRQLNTLLKANKDDREFSEMFATRMGPKRTMEFWAEMADPYQGGSHMADHKDREKLLKQLQTELGSTLGTATQSDSKAMQAWEKEIVELGPQRLGTDHAGNPFGFQVMSNLMRHGDYDDKFLLDYGNSLVSHERQLSNGADLDMLWTGNTNTADLNFGAGNDRGNDPMTGYLEALGHNPGASADFFKKEENFDYLVGGGDTKARDWPADAVLGEDNGKVAGHNSLGHALESATIGRPHGADVPPLDRNADGAAVMERLVTSYGRHPELMHERPGIEDSISKVGAAYIDDLNNGVSDFGERNGDARDPLYDTKGQAHANISRGDARDFLTVMGQNENTHAAMSQAQQAYTLGVMDSTHNTTEAASTAGTGAEVHGILDGSRLEQIEADYKDNEEKQKESLGKSTEWVKWGTGAVIGGAVGIATGGVGAAIAVPLAAETAGGALETFVGQQIDDTAKKYEADNADDLITAQREYTDTGENHAALPVTAYNEAHGIGADSSTSRQLTTEVRNGYDRGESSRPAYKRED
ncbi:hypothetical protein ACYSUO_22375 [Streptomyces sp. UC4497]